MLELAGFLLFCSFPLYSVGTHFFTALILRTPSTKARPLFGISFTLSVSLLLLILLEVLGVLAAGTRTLLWRVHLGLDLVLLVAVLPLAQISILLQRWSLSQRLVFIPMLVWLWVFHQIGASFPLLAGSGGLDVSFFGGLQNVCLSRAGVIGVSVSAAMSGIGAVSGPTSSISRLLHAVGEDELRQAEKSLLQALHATLQHRSHLSQLKEEQRVVVEQDAAAGHASAERAGLTATLSTWTLRLIPLALRNASYRKAAAEVRRSAREERVLRNSLQRRLSSLSELVTERERAALARTPRGRLFNLLGYIFSVYCIFKCWTATRCILWQHGVTPSEDPVTRALRIALRLLRLGAIDVAFWSQAISLALVGVMIFSSVKGFLVQAYRIRVRADGARRCGSSSRVAADSRACDAAAGAAGVTTTGSSGTAAELAGCAAAHVMGFYFLSSVILTRASLPSQYHKGINDAVGGHIEFAFYHHWFDSIFLAAASLTLAEWSIRRSHRLRDWFGSADAAAQLAQRRLHHAAQASARRQQRTAQRIRSPVVGSASPSSILSSPALGPALGGPRGSILRCRPAAAASAAAAAAPASPGQLLSEFTPETVRRAEGQDPAAALVAGATVAQRQSTQALLDFVSTQMEAMDVIQPSNGMRHAWALVGST